MITRRHRRSVLCGQDAHETDGARRRRRTRKRRSFREFVCGTGGIAAILCSVTLWYCFLALDSPGLDWIENVAGFAPVKYAITQWVTPQVFRSEFGMNVPPSLLDGMALIKQLAPLPAQPQPHGGGKRPNKGSSSDDASAKVAIAIPFSPSRVSGVLATLRMYRDLPPDADVDIVLVCSRDEKALQARPKLLTELHALAQEISGNSLAIVYSMLTERQDRSGASKRGHWLMFFHALQYLDAAGYSAVLIADTNVSPLRRGWGAALTAQVNDNEDWWVRGGTSYAQRSPAQRMDGNMLYRLGDNRLYVFLGTALQLYVGSAHASVEPTLGYGEAINRLYLQVLPVYKLAKQLVGRIAETSVIVNLEGMGCASPEEVREAFPFAFLVHNSQHVGTPDGPCPKKRLPAE